MFWPFHHKALANYWLRIFALYALIEACIQLLFCYTLNNYGDNPISNPEFHGIMWLFQCLLIWPIWWVAWSVRKKSILIQVLVNFAFFIGYSYFWFFPVQDTIEYLHQQLQQWTRPATGRLKTPVDNSADITYLNYQLLKHSFRLSWFFLANYFYHYRLEEKKRLELAVANKELQLKLLKWHLNPVFYFKTIDYLRQMAAESPLKCTRPILQLAKVMEYVIYEVKEKLIDVKKEIHFLSNYMQLVSSQQESHAVFMLRTEGEYDKLKIAPLLLVGFIDKMVNGKNDKGQQVYDLQLQFSGNTMHLKLEGELENGHPGFLNPGEPLYTRLNELYDGKFWYEQLPGGRQVQLSLKLDEER